VSDVNADPNAPPLSIDRLDQDFGICLSWRGPDFGESDIWVWLYLNRLETLLARTGDADRL
jgi:hypothetical protein